MNSNTELDANSSSRMRPDTLAASVTILLVANIVQRSIGFGRGILFCRWLSPDALGEWEMAYSFLLLAAPVIVLGLPGSFGRYLERYRQRGQLRTFLRRATVWTFALTMAGCGIIIAAASRFSDLIFGRPDCTTLVAAVTLSLVAVILHHFLESLFSALRKFSIVSTMQFCQSISFAVISLGLMCWWRLGTESIIVGYGAACLVSVIGVLVWKGGAVAEEAALDGGIPHSEFWPPLVRFALWVWIINFCCHLFGVIDRYMLVHFSGLNNEAALALVGQYHASRIIPLLFLSLADLLGSAVLPYLSHDWEIGARQRVSDRLNTAIKLTSLVMMAGAVAVMWIAPLLFHFAFQDRYETGLAVMPWTLTYCVWYSLLLIAQNYVWCAEKAKLGVLPVVGGLAMNIGINLVLVPAWGLSGAVVSTTIATGSALVMMYWINRRVGMRLDLGMVLLSVAPAALCGGVWCATAVLLALAAALLLSRTLLTQDERDLLAEFGQSHLGRLNSYLLPTRKHGEASHVA